MVMNKKTGVGRLFMLTLAASAALLAGNAQASNITWNVAGDGAWDTSSANWTGDSTTFTSDGTVNVVFNKSAGGTITVSPGMLPLSTTVSAGAGTYKFSGGPIASGSLTKSGSGTLAIDDLVPGSGTAVANTFSGGTTMNGGTLHLGGMYNDISPICSGALGAGTVTLNAGTIEFDRYTESNPLIANGGTLYSQNGWGATWSGPITLNATLTCNAGYALTLGGAISGTGGLTMQGGNTLTLSVSNSYAGATSVTGTGTLQCNNAGSLGNGGALSIASGAKANLNYTGTHFVPALTLGGVAQVPGSYGSSASPATFTNNTYFSGTGTVTMAPALIMTFGLPGKPAVINQNAKTIAWTVPYGTAVTNLAPTYTVNSATTNFPASGSANDFTSPVTYTVIYGTTTNRYQVTVSTMAASTNKDILTFGLPGNSAYINGTNITLSVPVSQPVTNLAPTYTVSLYATGAPASGASLDFTTPRTYTITAQDGSTKKYLVTVQTYLAWSNSASFYVLTTTNGAYLPAAALETNFPILLRLNATSFNFSQAQSTGADIRFTTASGTGLPYEIEQWDAVKKTATIWVLLPSIRGNTNQQLVMYWGNPTASSQSSGASVFNSANGYCCVLHMNGNVLDSTGSTSPVNNGATPTNAVIGSTAWDLGSGGISVANITNFPAGTSPSSTSEIWLRARKVNQWSQIMGWGNQNAYGWNTWIMQIGFWQSMGGSPLLPAPVTCYGPGQVYGVTPIAAQQWYHVVYTSKNGTGAIYVNGVLDATATGGSQTIVNPQAMAITAIGGGGGDADVDEARVSSFVRSTNWIRLEYQNQNPLQTLVGNLVQPGSTFSVSATNVTMAESTTTNLMAQAGGAAKVYWLLKQNSQSTVIAVDQFACTIAPGRVTGDQSFVIEFKAVYPDGTIQIADVPFTVLDTIPDPVVTLVPSANPWDGRTTMTVTPVISNWAALQAAGVTNLIYNWSLAGVAVTVQNPPAITAPGTFTSSIMTLLRSQGSGVLTATLVLNNGGASITNTITVTVQPPATDAWLARTPGATEKGVNNQFYARNPGTGLGTIFYNGTQSGSPNSVYVKIYTTDTGSDVPYSTNRQSLVGGAYAFSVPIAAGKATYKLVYGTNYSSVDTPVGSAVTNIVCGDAYIIDGQSNALATDNVAPNDPTTDPWIRTYGKSLGWGYAISKGSEMQLGLWGWYLAKYLAATYNLPVCIINSAVGGTRIDQHQPNPANRYDTSGDPWSNPYNIYGNLLTRVSGGKLTHGIRGVFWHQGENNSGAADPTGDFDYKSYQAYFMNMTGAWKQDFPNIQRYIVWQVMPAPCSMGPVGDQLREAQRTLPRMFSNMDMLNTLGIAGYEGCHFSPTGYANFALRLRPLVGKDYYNVNSNVVVTAANLVRAYYTTTARTEIALEFDQGMTWNTYAKANFYLDKVGSKVSSGSASGNVVKLQLSSAGGTNSTLDYLEDAHWSYGETTSSLLYGTNAIPALTFADVPIALAVTAFPPAITSLSPVTGRTNGGTVVTLTGSNFLSGAIVQFGGSSATAVTVNSATNLTATTPAHAPGLVSVIVSNTNGLSATNLNAFSYVLPPPPATLSSLAQLNGTLMVAWAGGTNQSCVLLTGTNVTQPRASWSPVATNTVEINGLSTNTIPIRGDELQRFYRLSIPYN
jgi:hypothetical protein